MTGALDMAVLAFGLLGGGTLTGKFNKPGGPVEPTREKEADARAQTAAAVIMQVAAETGRTPSQVAINWVRQQAPQIIPILGARRESQLIDNLGALEFTLTGEQLKCLADANPIKTEFPHTFWNDHIRRNLIFGERVDQLELPA